MKERLLCIKGLIKDGGKVMKYVYDDLHLAQVFLFIKYVGYML